MRWVVVVVVDINSLSISIEKRSGGGSSMVVVVVVLGKYPPRVPLAKQWNTKTENKEGENNRNETGP